MIACTDVNPPDNGGSSETVTPTDTTITTTDTICITWNGASASIVGSHENVTVSDNSGYVTVNSTVKDITYILSGSGQGQLTIYGTNRHELILRDLSLICSDGPAINNQCKKSCFVVLEGTNSLTDGATYTTTEEDRKGAFFSEGQMFFSGGGSIEITGNCKHALVSDDYIHFAASTGVLTLTAKVSDGIHANDGIFINGGTFVINATDEGIRTDSNTIAITGGDITVFSKTEGIESKGTITIDGGKIYSQAVDDAINSGGDLTINGGYVCAYSTGNDGIDANGNCYINGGVVYAIGSRSPEVAIDANTEERKQLYVNGGTIIAIGGLERGSSLSQACYQTSSINTKNWYALYDGAEPVLAFQAAANVTPMVVSTGNTPTLKLGVTVNGGTTIFNGKAVINGEISGGSDVSLTTYSAQDGGGPGQGGNPGGGGGRPGGH